MAESETITLDREAANLIFDALLIGLSSYSEIERLVKVSPGSSLVPMHPTGSDETAGDFADALRYLRQAMA